MATDNIHHTHPSHNVYSLLLGVNANTPLRPTSHQVFDVGRLCFTVTGPSSDQARACVLQLTRVSGVHSPQLLFTFLLLPLADHKLPPAADDAHFTRADITGVQSVAVVVEVATLPMIGVVRLPSDGVHTV